MSVLRLTLAGDKRLSVKLNIAAFCPASQALGPGKRFIVWVQGCCFSCQGCISPEWREMKEAMRISVAELAGKILQTPDLEGITISGGEPMLQANNLFVLTRLIRSVRPFSVICYTGFSIEELKEKNNPAIDGLLKEIDVLIDGRYIENRNNDKGLRGSNNQSIHFLTGLYKDREEYFISQKRDIEFHMLSDHYLIVGVHPVDFNRIVAL
jgi:anaerobic ribonucleoside-triphosphate reductase activating protein